MKTLKTVLKRFEFDWTFFLMLIFIIVLNIFLFTPEKTSFNMESEFETIFYRYVTGFLTGVFIMSIFTEILLILKDIKDEEAKHEQRQK